MVNADNDVEYLQINDISMYQAFEFFTNYGFTANKSNSYNQTLNTISQSNASGTFTFSGAFSGSFNAAIELSYFGKIQDPELGIAGIIGTGTDHIGGSNVDETMTLKITQTTDGEYQGHNTDDNFACTYHPNSTAATSTINCVYSGNAAKDYFDIGELQIEVDELDIYGSHNDTYLVTLKNEGTETGSLTGNLSLSGSGQGSLSITENGTSTTTTVNTNSLQFVLPVMSANGNINNDYAAKKLFQGRRYLNSDDEAFTMIALRNVTAGQLKNGKIKTSSGNEYSITASNVVDNRMGTEFVIDAFTILNTEEAWYYYVFPDSFKWWDIIPLYVGSYNHIPDDLFRFVYGQDRTINAIDAQTAADQQHHDEMMDTSESSKISTDGNALVSDADEKFGDLFFPLQHAVDTAHDLANVNATGVIRLPAIFKDDYWYLDLTVIERNLPQAWSFIQSLCQLAVAIYMIKGLYNLFFGGGKEDDS